METNGDNFAVIVPFLAYMAYQFFTLSPEEISKLYMWEMFLFLLAVFIALTNQVGTAQLFPTGTVTSWESSSASSLYCVSVQTNISVTTGRNFLILGMMMGFGLGLMLVIFLIQSGIPDTDRNVCFQKRFQCY